MDLGVGEMGFIFCGKHPLLITRIQVSDPGPKGLLFIVANIADPDEMSHPVAFHFGFRCFQ